MPKFMLEISQLKKLAMKNYWIFLSHSEKLRVENFEFDHFKLFL